MDDDALTAAYLRGYHSRDDEVSALRKRIAGLEAELAVRHKRVEPKTPPVYDEDFDKLIRTLEKDDYNG